MEEKNISVLDIAAAEQQRGGVVQTTPDPRVLLIKFAKIAGGVALLALALGVLYFVLTRDTSVPAQEQARAPYVYVDGSTPVAVPSSTPRAALMEQLVEAQKCVKLPLGLIARLEVVEPSVTDEQAREWDAQTFLQRVAPRVPQELLRTLELRFLLGVHSFDLNQPFLIIKTDSFETAFSALLRWEETLYADLQPLFARVPGGVASAPAFADLIVENRDTRAVVDAEGRILLLWALLDRSTILITTNEYTLREVVRRLSETSILPLP